MHRDDWLTVVLGTLALLPVCWMLAQAINP
jgi:hypothetical protein